MCHPLQRGHGPPPQCKVLHFPSWGPSVTPSTDFRIHLFEQCLEGQ